MTSLWPFHVFLFVTSFTQNGRSLSVSCADRSMQHFHTTAPFLPQFFPRKRTGNKVPFSSRLFVGTGKSERTKSSAQEAARATPVSPHALSLQRESEGWKGNSSSSSFSLSRALSGVFAVTSCCRVPRVFSALLFSRQHDDTLGLGVGWACFRSS